MDGSLFSVLIDESRDISVKEQMAIVVRYVFMLSTCVLYFFLYSVIELIVFF